MFNSSIGTCMKNLCFLSRHAQRQMTSISVIIFASTSQLIAVLYLNQASEFHYSTISASKSNCFSSSVQIEGSQRRYFGSSISKLKNSCHLLILRTAVNPRYTWKPCLDISIQFQNVNMRLFLPNQSKVPGKTDAE